MSKSMSINVKHVTRIEGHANIVVNVTDGKVEKLQWQVPEAPRFFEAMVRGRSYEDIQLIVSRICGICSISHSLVATKAVEDALGIEVSEQLDGTYYSLGEGKSTDLAIFGRAAIWILGGWRFIKVVATVAQSTERLIRIRGMRN